MNNDIQVLGFDMTYPKMTLEVQRKTPGIYELGILYMLTKESEKGFYSKKIKKATKKGTTITYKAFESQEEADDYMEKLIERKNKLADFNITEEAVNLREIIEKSKAKELKDKQECEVLKKEN